MSNDTALLRFECPDCHGLIEMPVPTTPPDELHCPHCGYIMLPRPPARLSAAKIMAVIVIFLLMAAVGFFVAVALKRGTTPRPQVHSAEPAALASVSTNQFTISSVRLEKEGALRYVQGTVSNGLAQQRFGVKIHLELLDTNELRVGSASDYRPMVQPNEVWQFRALVVEPGAASAAVIAIQEDQ
jgi:hypothetical protein